jgi:DNA-binding phage protein
MKNLACRKLGAQHLTLGLDSGKAELFQEAFRNVVEKEGGLKVIAKKAKMSLRQIQRVMSDREAFQLWVDIAKIVKGLGGHMDFAAEPKTFRRGRSRV